jgi:hypothetical protein
MKVRIHESALNDKNCWRHLNTISQLFFEGRHRWEIDDPDEIEQSARIQDDLGGRAGGYNLETLRRCFTASAYPPENKFHSLVVEIRRDCTAANHLAPELASNYLYTPARVLVENVESDGNFLQFLAVTFSRRALLDAHTAGWWTIDQLGGYGEVAKRYVQISEQSSGPARVFVFTDSDRLHPTHNSGTVRKVEDACREHRIPFAILKKRKIENYLPLLILQKVNNDRFTVYLRLDRTQRDHYEMKRGFRTDEKTGDPVIPLEQAELYQHVHPRDIRLLCGGFGNDVAEHFKTDRGKFHSEEVKMICENDPDEIDRVLDQIESVL